MDIESIKTFYMVAQYKSFRKAADILMLTQSGVSKRIHNLENELGHSLFVRTHKSVSLSKCGEEYLSYAKRILKIHDEWLGVINNVKEEAIKIAIPFSMDRFFPEIFQTFIDEYGIPIRVHGANSDEIYEMLIDRTIDMGITAAVFPSPQIDYEIMFKERMLCVARPEIYTKCSRDGQTTNPIPFVLCKTHNFRVHPWDAMIESISNNELVDVVITVNSVGLGRLLTMKGFGASVLPYTEVKRELESGELIEVTIPNFVLPNRVTYIAVNRQIHVNVNLERLKETILKYSSTLSYDS